MKFVLNKFIKLFLVFNLLCICTIFNKRSNNNNYKPKFEINFTNSLHNKISNLKLKCKGFEDCIKSILDLTDFGTTLEKYCNVVIKKLTGINISKISSTKDYKNNLTYLKKNRQIILNNYTTHLMKYYKYYIITVDYMKNLKKAINFRRDLSPRESKNCFRHISSIFIYSNLYFKYTFIKINSIKSLYSNLSNDYYAFMIDNYNNKTNINKKIMYFPEPLKTHEKDSNDDLKINNKHNRVVLDIDNSSNKCSFIKISKKNKPTYYLTQIDSLFEVLEDLEIYDDEKFVNNYIKVLKVKCINYINVSENYSLSLAKISEFFNNSNENSSYNSNTNSIRKSDYNNNNTINNSNNKKDNLLNIFDDNIFDNIEGNLVVNS